MKTLILLSTIFFLMSCGKKTTYTEKANPNTPTDSTSSDANGVYTTVEQVNLTSSIHYQYDSVLDKKEVSYHQEDQYVLAISNIIQIPQNLILTKGWAGLNDTATLKIIKEDNSTLNCHYQSLAKQTHYSQQNSQDGAKYVFKSCDDNLSSPTNNIHNVYSVNLKLNKADDLFQQTEASATIKVLK